MWRRPSILHGSLMDLAILRRKMANSMIDGSLTKPENTDAQ
jgi:hypothetical protein